MALHDWGGGGTMACLFKKYIPDDVRSKNNVEIVVQNQELRNVFTLNIVNEGNTATKALKKALQRP